eukprot:COSAG06_NODE_689_length_13068_cov_9.661269_16_plen_177_part_00
MPPPRTGPLANVVCVDLTRQLAGPQASRILSDLGARVIKVEQTGSSGDLIEASPHYFAAVNHSKERVELDLRSDEGRASFDALLEAADILTENFRPGVMNQMGYSWESVHARFPHLIMASVSGFGQVRKKNRSQFLKWKTTTVYQDRLGTKHKKHLKTGVSLLRTAHSRSCRRWTS